MKLLFLTTMYYPNQVGGAEETVRLLAKAVRDGSDEPVVVSLSPDGTASRGEVDGVRTVTLPLANLYNPHTAGARPAWLKPVWHLLDAWNPVMARRLGAVLDEERPDLVHFHNVQGFSSAAWGAVRRRNIPMVQTLHDYYVGCLNSSMFRGGRNCDPACAACRVGTLPRRKLGTCADVVTAVSRRMVGRLNAAGAFRDTPVRIIRGCNISEPVRAPRPAPGTPLRVGFLGRLDPLKGVDLLLSVVGRFPANRIIAIVAGRGAPDYEAALKARFDNPRIRFRGFMDPDVFFREIDVLAVPSRWEEPLGRIVHEAFGHAVPVIGAAAGGIPEILEDGRTGFLFRAEDEADLERVIRSLLDDPPDWESLSANALAAADAFRLDRIVWQYREAWADAMLRHGVAERSVWRTG